MKERMQERRKEGAREALPAAPATPEGQGGAASAGGRAGLPRAAPARACSRRPITERGGAARATMARWRRGRGLPFPQDSPSRWALGKTFIAERAPAPGAGGGLAAVFLGVQPVVRGVVGRLGEAHGRGAVAVADEHVALVVAAWRREQERSEPPLLGRARP